MKRILAVFILLLTLISCSSDKNNQTESKHTESSITQRRVGENGYPFIFDITDSTVVWLDKFEIYGQEIKTFHSFTRCPQIANLSKWGMSAGYAYSNGYKPCDYCWNG